MNINRTLSRTWKPNVFFFLRPILAFEDYMGPKAKGNNQSGVARDRVLKRLSKPTMFALVG